jgi:hypothetical protein
MSIQNFLGMVTAFSVGWMLATAGRAMILLDMDYECTMARMDGTYITTGRELEFERSVILMVTHDGRTVALQRSSVQECKKL